jgi:molybdate transport system substrate-binding protein
MNKRTAWMAMLIFALLLTTSPLARTARAQQPGGEITVYAAASLREAFNDIGRQFSAKHAGARVTYSFAGSQQLAEQIGYGAPADVFASANTRLMDAVIKTTRVTSGTQQIFTRNRLVVVLPRNNPASIRTLKDLSKPGLKLVLAAKAVPVGQYSLDFLNKASTKAEFGKTFSQSVLSNVVSYEEDVRAVFGKVSLGEADAGIVYSSDVAADKKNTLRTIAIPDNLNTLAAYPIAPLNDSRNAALAQAFVDFVMSIDGQATLAKYGFITRK